MLFGTKKETNSSAQRDKALALINEAFADLETKGDRAYLTGLIEMAFALGAITLNERANLKDRAYKADVR